MNGPSRTSIMTGLVSKNDQMNNESVDSGIEVSQDELNVVTQNKKKVEEKVSNTIMNQINTISKKAMNDTIADQTLEDHKYLLEHVENRCAIAFFSVTNRNQSFYNALQRYYTEINNGDEVPKKGRSSVQQDNVWLENIFIKMIKGYDFMSLVMYDTLKDRREFIHDTWIIAKATDNDELKIAISKDEFFYITRDDILVLLQTKDDKLMTQLLKTKVRLNLREDISYKLVAIKNEQVDQNQMTPVYLIDFLSVMVQNKRSDPDDFKSDIMFSNKQILKFLMTHEEFVNAEEVVKILILSRRFRLSLYYMQYTKIAFNIEFFTNALESNAYDIAFYLLKVYDEQILQNTKKAIDAHVQTYEMNNQFLRAKLHMSKMMIDIFNFNAAQQFLIILKQKAFEDHLENNMFTHSKNPLLTMCLTYELLQNIIKKFFSLNNDCQMVMKHILEMTLHYIESIDDENFLTAIMLEKDYSGRDSLMIAVELELLDLIQAPKVEASIKRIYNSDFEVSGNLFEMSTPYKIIYCNKNLFADIESDYRFYKQRSIKDAPQSGWLFEILKESMSSKIQAFTIIALIYVVFSAFYFEIVIETVQYKTHYLRQLNSIHHEIVRSNNLTHIELLLSESDYIFDHIKDEADSLYFAFYIISILSFANLSFLVQHIMTFLVTKRLGRFYTLQVLHFTDTILAICSMVIVHWFSTKIQKDLYSDPNLSHEEHNMRVLANFEENIDFKFQFFFSICIICLILRVMTMLQYSEQIGPLIKILSKMLENFLSFSILYVILLIMFSTVGNMNFIIYLTEFQGAFQSILTIIDASLGNCDFEIFNQVHDPGAKLFGQILMILAIACFNILLMNLIIAMLANTYSIFDARSKGLYLAKILSSRCELNYDEYFGAFLFMTPVINLIQVPVLPLAMSFKYGSTYLKKINNALMIVQYILFMLVLFLAFVIVSIVLIPLAWIIGIVDKIGTLKSLKSTHQKILNVFIFIPFGPIILLFDVLADLYYFWANNFRTDLKKIIIQREKSSVTHISLKEFTQALKYFQKSQIKSSNVQKYVKIFRRQFNVNQNIQFLLFGQMIPLGGFKDEVDFQANKQFTFKSMKTQDLADQRNEEKLYLDDTAQFIQSKQQLGQFNQVKKIVHNLCFKHKSQNVLSIDIIINVMDEMRMERKIKMILQDKGVDEYIQTDITDIDMHKLAKDESIIENSDYDLETQKLLQDKLEFRYEFCDQMSLIKLNYMFRVLENIYGQKASMSDPDAFKEKIKSIERAAKTKALNRQGTGISSQFGQSSKSYLSVSEYGGTQGSEFQQGTNRSGGGAETGSRITRAILNDPIFVGIASVFQEFSAEFENMGHERMRFLKRQHRGKPKHNEWRERATNNIKQRLISKMQSSTENQDNQLKMVQESWVKVQGLGHELVGELLFRKIFEIAPEAIELFPFKDEPNMYESKKFKKHALGVVLALEKAVQNFDSDPEKIQRQLKALGSRHVKYGVQKAHYAIVGQALDETLAAGLQDAYTKDLREAWLAIYSIVQETMTA